VIEMTVKIIDEVMEITERLAECFSKHFPELTAYAVNDIPGEDHVYARDTENGKAMFDLLVSSSRKFVFLWYYVHPKKGYEMVEEMKELTLLRSKDFAVKYPNIPVKPGFPCIVRYGKNPAGNPKKWITKGGNPQLSKEIFTEKNLNTYRDYEWMNIDNALDLIQAKALEMVKFYLNKRNKPEKIDIFQGMVLYAGCAYSYLYPELGFGMRDIDVNAFFDHTWKTNTRCALTQGCDIEEFGRPEYFGGNTRWLDLMWNNFHAESGIFSLDVNMYIDEMRKKSDRWATISQRPVIDLATKETIYLPNWLKKLEKEIAIKE